MAITTLDGYIASAKQRVTFMKNTSRTGVAGRWTSVFDIAGNPGAGTLNVGNTANGLVPTDATAGFPVLNAFGGSAGYLSKVDFGSTVASRLMLYDRLFHAGAYAYNANTTLASVPSFASRVPNTIYAGLQIWVEAVTAMTGVLNVNVGYKNEAGVSHTTGVKAVDVALILGRMYQLSLAAGDSGVSQIESVVATVASGGTFNIVVVRPLWIGCVPTVGGGDIHGLDKTGMPVVYTDSAMQVAVAAYSTATGVPSVEFEVCNG